MNLMFAITGGIACGKSEFAKFLTEAGCEVLDADDIVRQLQARDGAALPLVREAFGARVFLDDGSLDRAALAGIVFNDVNERRKLESIMHPLVREAFHAWRETPPRAPRAAIIPLLFETGWQRDWPHVTCVAAAPELQMERLLRRGLSEKDAAARVNAQLPLAEKTSRSQCVVWNNGTLAELRAQALQWIEKVTS